VPLNVFFDSLTFGELAAAIAKIGERP
jgi:hypothetical protein